MGGQSTITSLSRELIDLYSSGEILRVKRFPFNPIMISTSKLVLLQTFCHSSVHIKNESRLLTYLSPKPLVQSLIPHVCSICWLQPSPHRHDRNNLQMWTCQQENSHKMRFFSISIVLRYVCPYLCTCVTRTSSMFTTTWMSAFQTSMDYKG